MQVDTFEGIAAFFGEPPTLTSMAAPIGACVRPLLSCRLNSVSFQNTGFPGARDASQRGRFVVGETERERLLPSSHPLKIMPMAMS